MLNPVPDDEYVTVPPEIIDLVPDEAPGSPFCVQEAVFSALLLFIFTVALTEMDLEEVEFLAAVVSVWEYVASLQVTIPPAYPIVVEGEVNVTVGSPYDTPPPEPTLLCAVTVPPERENPEAEPE